MSLRISGGTLKGRRLKTPKTSRTRPTSEKLRQAFFNINQHRLPDSRFLDLFAGTGAMGIEAMSRGAASATFIEQDKRALSCLRENVEALDISSQCLIIAGDVRKVLQRTAGQFDIIYIDPPYGQGLGDATIALLDNSDILAQNGLIFLEETEYTEHALEHLTLREKRPFGERFLFIFDHARNSSIA